MDEAFLSHVVLWIIGAMTLCSIVGAMGAMVAMGRQGYRKD